MTAREVKKRVDALRATERDTENDRGKEDELYVDVLQAIAKGETRNAKGLASAVLKTRNFIKERWYA